MEMFSTARIFIALIFIMMTPPPQPKLLPQRRMVRLETATLLLVTKLNLLRVSTQNANRNEPREGNKRTIYQPLQDIPWVCTPKLCAPLPAPRHNEINKKEKGSLQF